MVRLLDVNVFFYGCNGGWTRGPDLPHEWSEARGVMPDEKRWWVVGGEFLTKGVDEVIVYSICRQLISPHLFHTVGLQVSVQRQKRRKS